MRRLVGVAALLACETACTHPRLIGQDGRGLKSRLGEKGKVTTREGQVIEATPRSVRGKTLFVPEDGSPALDVALVDHVSYDSAGRGAADGLAFGFGLGAATGGVFGAIASTEDTQRGGGADVLLGAIAGGLVGAVVGLIVGVAVEATYEYQISPRP